MIQRIRVIRFLRSFRMCHGAQLVAGIALSVIATSMPAFKADAIEVVQFQNPESGVLSLVRERQVIVEFEPGVSPQQRQTICQLVPGSWLDDDIGWKRSYLHFGASIDPFSVAATLRADPIVRNAAVNAVGSFEAAPQDPGLEHWWFLGGFEDYEVGDLSIGLAEYWIQYELNPGAEESVPVVLFDTGIDMDHPEFDDRTGVDSDDIRLFKSFVTGLDAELDENPPEPFGEAESPRDFFGHGTEMAGIIGAESSVESAGSAGIAGIAYQNPLWVYKVGSVAAIQNGYVDIRYVLTAIDSLSAAIDANPSMRFVANMSFGWLASQLSASERLMLKESLLELQSTNKCLVVAATGNQPDAFWSLQSNGPPPLECTDPGTIDMTVKYPAAFSGGAAYQGLSAVMAVGASRLIDSYGLDPCDCLEPQSDEFADKRAWASYSRYLSPEPGQPECAPLVDILAPGGARMALTAQDLSCGGANIYTTTLSSDGDGMRWIWGTSVSTAIVSSVAAAVWARDITLTPQQLIAHLKAYADRSAVYDMQDGIIDEKFRYTTVDLCIDPPDPNDSPDLVSLWPTEDEVVEASGRAGAGILNAGRAISILAATEVQYLTSGTISQSTTIGNVDVLVLAGEVLVASGATLTLGNADGTEMLVWVESPESILEVEGNLELCSPVHFSSYIRSTDENLWEGIRIEPGASLTSNGHILRVENATVGLTVEGTADPLSLGSRFCETALVAFGDIALASGTSISDIGEVSIDAIGAEIQLLGDIAISDTTAEDSSVVNGAMEISALPGQINGSGEWVFDSATLTSSSQMPTPGAWSGIATSSDLDIRGTLQIEFATIALFAGSAIHVEGLVIQNCQSGIISAGNHPSTIRGTQVLGSTGTPVLVSGGDLTLGPDLLVDGSGSGISGMLLDALAELTWSGPVTVRNSQLHGVVLQNSSATNPWSGLTATANDACGVRIEASAVDMRDGVVLTNNGTGLYFDSATAVVDGVVSSGNSAVGITSEGGSSIVVRNSTVQNNLAGVVVGESSLASLTPTNDFSGNSPIMVSNFNASEIVDATENYWGAGQHGPPQASLFQGLVDYADYLTTAP